MAHHARGVVAHLRRLPLLEGRLDESRTLFPWRHQRRLAEVRCMRGKNVENAS